MKTYDQARQEEANEAIKGAPSHLHCYIIGTFDRCADWSKSYFNKKREADKAIINSMAQDIVKIANAVGFKGEESSELAAYIEKVIAEKNEELISREKLIKLLQYTVSGNADELRSAEQTIAEKDAEISKTWTIGYPDKIRGNEWFIAILKDGTKAVLKALTEEYSHDFKTADETYYTKDWVIKWMQFPNSNYISFVNEKLTSAHDIIGELKKALWNYSSEATQSQATGANEALKDLTKWEKANK